MDKELAIKCACYHFDYKWPRDQWTGVIFFEGYKITIEEFNKIAKLFR